MMIRRPLALAALLLVGSMVVRATSLPVAPSVSSARAPYTPADATELLNTYCVKCHGDDAMVAGLSLEHFDTAKPETQVEVAEKVVRRLAVGMMPPAGEKRPDAAAVAAFRSLLETRIDTVAAAKPNPGARPFMRLSRVEYARSIKDLLDLDVDIEAYLPPDTVSHGFDNVADAQTFSPSLLEGYMRAARKISVLALGDAAASPTQATYKVPRTANQYIHVPGAPMGTRGGLSIVHNFPADATYTLKISLQASPTGQLFGSTARNEQMEVSVNGERALLIDVNPALDESKGNGMTITTDPITVKAGPQRLSVAFIQRRVGPVDDLISPIEHTLADSQIGTSPGITAYPHLRDVAILGPTKITGVSDTPSRRRILTCRPSTAADEAPCATKIVTALAKDAYRRPLTPADVSALMRFYTEGRKTSFEEGVRTAIQAMLASPNFVFRLEEAPASVKAGTNYRVSDVDLASRLSYFLWASAPDQALIRVAASGTLRQPAVLEQQVRRMLADSRADALSTRFAAQWLRLQDLEGMHPDALLYPQYDHTLGEAMRTETELFFGSIVREDRNVMDLLTADYTYLNDRLAAHYGVPNVAGPRFRRVQLVDANRRGLLGQGSILTLTSVADRTSPVLRGKWVMEVLLGTPPPPPPPNVPALNETKGDLGGRLLTVRERMEEHRKNPACMSCHKVIDPLGLSLENFDVTGKWRIKDSGMPVDPASTLFDGTPLNGPTDLRNALVARKDTFQRTFTEYLMTYALGRRVEFFDQPAIRAIQRDASLKNSRFSAFVVGIVKSAAFQMSRSEAGQ